MKGTAAFIKRSARATDEYVEARAASGSRAGQPILSNQACADQATVDAITSSNGAERIAPIAPVHFVSGSIQQRESCLSPTSTGGTCAFAREITFGNIVGRTPSAG
ncbi:hypothetical protein FS749_006642 [Ceratobasidium sp. UAMH 11750]|nr:hypothetical protein FS749_006642 [Ceratobasidium sp. UAMH 11750]